MKCSVRGREIHYKLCISNFKRVGWFNTRTKDIFINIIFVIVLGRKVIKETCVHEETHKIINEKSNFYGDMLPVELRYVLRRELEEIIAEIVSVIVSSGSINSYYMDMYDSKSMTQDEIELVIDWSHYLLTKHWNVPVQKCYVEWMLSPHIKKEN